MMDSLNLFFQGVTSMFLRSFIALAVLTGLAAFSAASPAPFPRTDRKKAVEDVVRLQGTYKVTNYGQAAVFGGGGGFGRGGGGGVVFALQRPDMKVRIQNDKFAFLHNNGADFQPTTTYEMKLVPNTSPKQVDMTYNTGNYTVTMKGIYKIEGNNKVSIAYVSTITGARFNVVARPQVERPASFENLPPSAMLLTLERE